MYVLYSAKRQPLISLLSKRGSRLLLVRLNVGARTDDVWSRGFSRPKGKNFLKNRDFSSVTGTSASDKRQTISTIDTVRLELCF